MLLEFALQRGLMMSAITAWRACPPSLKAEAEYAGLFFIRRVEPYVTGCRGAPLSCVLDTKFSTFIVVIQPVTGAKKIQSDATTLKVKGEASVPEQLYNSKSI